ncbi:unnamed protein product [Gordionus sp. m RMFG-2023]
MANKVNVAIRIRPFSKRECDLNSKPIIKIDKNQTILYHPKSFKDAKTFAFDYCFDSNEDSNAASQSDIFEKIGLDVLNNAFMGYNACIFAYGQTGSGKSYTMMGTSTDQGIIPRLCEKLFDRIDTTNSGIACSEEDSSYSCKSLEAGKNTKYKVEVSYIEIYNERVHDLLDPTGEKKSLKVREHNLLGPYVENLTLLAVASYADISMLLREGNKSRIVAATNMNTESSRSHAVFTIHFTQSRDDGDQEKIIGEKISKISLVDLAGSERVSKSGVIGERLKEGSNINKSLTTLGLVISTLAEQSSGNCKMHKFVPYRDSILTWLLKDNLGGNSVTTMISTLSPSSDNYEESLSTLRFANRAKRIVNHAIVNEDPRAKVIRELKEEVEMLKIQLNLRQETSTLERLKQSEDLMQELEMPWETKLAISEKIQQERQKTLENIGISADDTGIKMQNDKYYLVNLNSDPSLNEMLIYYLKKFKTLIGRPDTEPEQHIKLRGLGIVAHHCEIDIMKINRIESDEENDSEDINKGTVGNYVDSQLYMVYITPLEGASTCVNGSRIYAKTLLRHGDRILWGNYHFFRLNCPLVHSHDHNQSNSLISMRDNDVTGSDWSISVEANNNSINHQSTKPFNSIFESSNFVAVTEELALQNRWFLSNPVEMEDRESFDNCNAKNTIKESKDGNSSAGNLDIDTTTEENSFPLNSDSTTHRDNSLYFGHDSISLESASAKSEFSFNKDGCKNNKNNVNKSLATENGVKLIVTEKMGIKTNLEFEDNSYKIDFKRSSAMLRKRILNANLLVEEANLMAKELSVDICYRVTLRIPMQNLLLSSNKIHFYNKRNKNRQPYKLLCEPAILIVRGNYPEYIWSLDRFQNKIYEMRDIYNDNKNDPLKETFISDIFYDINYTEVLLGIANVYLGCLRYNVKFDYKVPIINQQGEVESLVYVHQNIAMVTLVITSVVKIAGRLCISLDRIQFTHGTQINKNVITNDSYKKHEFSHNRYLNPINFDESRGKDSSFAKTLVSPLNFETVHNSHYDCREDNYPNSSSAMDESFLSTESSGIFNSENPVKIETVFAQLNIKEALDIRKTNRSDSIYLQYEVPEPYNRATAQKDFKNDKTLHFVPNSNFNFNHPAKNGFMNNSMSYPCYTAAGFSSPVLVLERKFKKRKLNPSNNINSDELGTEDLYFGEMGQDSKGARTTNRGSNKCPYKRSAVKFKHRNTFRLDYPEENPESLNDSVLSIEVWCRKKLVADGGINIVGSGISKNDLSLKNKNSLSRDTRLNKISQNLALSCRPIDEFNSIGKNYINAKRKSLTQRWNEVKRKLQVWVRISELNDQGHFNDVKVIPESSSSSNYNSASNSDTEDPNLLSTVKNGTGGVYQLRQGRQRRVTIDINVATNNETSSQSRKTGQLPLMCETLQGPVLCGVVLRSEKLLSICAKNRNNISQKDERKQLYDSYDNKSEIVIDSYQEKGLKRLRHKWSRVIERRKGYLERELQRFSDTTTKSKDDVMREKCLMEQWITLTEERNALSLPSEGSDIPGSPADWNPPLGMEKHIPVIFLDLNLDHTTELSESQGSCDNLYQDSTNYDQDLDQIEISIGNSTPIIYQDSYLLGEPACDKIYTSSHSEFVKLNIIKECQIATNCRRIICAWDSSIHDSLYLNAPSASPSEKTYLILKFCVKLSHPASINVWLRKRICVNVLAQKLTLAEKIKDRIIRQEPFLTSCGVTYEIISSIPHESQHLENTRNLALLAASPINDDGLVNGFPDNDAKNKDDYEFEDAQRDLDEPKTGDGNNQYYIKQYMRSIANLNNLLSFDKVKQEFVVRELAMRNQHTKSVNSHESIHRSLSFNESTKHLLHANDGYKKDVHNIRGSPDGDNFENFEFFKYIGNNSSNDSHLQLEDMTKHPAQIFRKTIYDSSNSNHFVDYEGLSPLSAPNPPLFRNVKPMRTLLEEIITSTAN